MTTSEKPADASGVALTAGLEGSRHKHSAMWWVGQAMSIYLGIAAIGASGSIAVGAIVAYALALLVDIRESLSSNANFSGERSESAAKGS